MKSRLPLRYWLQFSASSISNVGDGLAVAATPLLALSLTDDTRLIGAVSFASSLPWLILTLPAGVIIDRLDRRRTMITVNWLRAIATDSLTIWMLIGLMIVIGSCEVLFDMTAQALLPAIVNSEQLERANGLLYTTEMICNNFIGLPAGSWLFIIAIGTPFGLNAASFALAAVIIARISLRSESDQPSPARHQFRRDLVDGLSWLWSHQFIRLLAIMLGCVNFAGALGAAIWVKYAADELGVTGSLYGALLAILAIGSILGGLIGDRIANKLGRNTILYAYIIFAVDGLVYSLFPSVAIIAMWMLFMGVASTTWNIVTVSLRQRLIPEELFGRVNSVYRFIGTGLSALGSLAGGFIAHSFGLRAPYLVGSVVATVALVSGGAKLVRYIVPAVTPAPPSIT
ncbi:MAG: hypothetical protein RIQ63_1233 [Actinomycetota bacterium]